jgi:dihydrofolate synthase/folylpolyglutamate synthase
VLDVAHNPHSVAALAENLDAMGYYPVTHAVFGAMADKDLPAMLERISSLIDRWHLTDLPLPRASRATDLAAVLDSGAGQASGGRSRVAGCHPSPLEALRAAVLEADPTDRIVVFGSFHTVGGVLKDGVPRLAARHLAN